MTVPKRTIEGVVRRRRLGDDDDDDTLAYWLARPMAERILEVEALRRMWIGRLGDPDRPMERVVKRRRLEDQD